MQEFIVPFVMTIITITLGAYTTVRIKYTASPKELVSTVKKDLGTLAEYAFLLVNSYLLVTEIISSEPLSRLDVFIVCLLSLAIFSFFLFRLIRRIINLQGQIVDSLSLQSQHTYEKFEKLIDALSPNENEKH